MKRNSANKIWGGRFDASPSQMMLEINQSISFDHKLYKQDIAGSIAHAQMLSAVKIISQPEAKKIIDGLKKIEKEIDSEKFIFKNQRIFSTDQSRTFKSIRLDDERSSNCVGLGCIVVRRGHWLGRFVLRQS